jgi:hypothetical protein
MKFLSAAEDPSYILGTYTTDGTTVNKRKVLIVLYE